MVLQDVPARVTHIQHQVPGIADGDLLGSAHDIRPLDLIFHPHVHAFLRLVSFFHFLCACRTRAYQEWLMETVLGLMTGSDFAFI
jgi:hypothetical protein